MAGVASHPLLTFELCCVDFLHHAHHSARGLFLRFVVLLECVFYMAILAMNSQRRSDELHRWQQQVGRRVVQYFQVLVDFTTFFIRARCGPVGGLGNRDHENQAEKSGRG